MEQLFLSQALQDLVHATAKFPRVKKRIEALSTDELACALNRALAAENLAFATYALMIATRAQADEEGRVTLVKLCVAVGYSYWAVRNQIRRAPWWATIEKNSFSLVSLTPEALTKLSRIAVRLSRHG